MASNTKVLCQMIMPLTDPLDLEKQIPVCKDGHYGWNNRYLCCDFVKHSRGSFICTNPIVIKKLKQELVAIWDSNLDYLEYLDRCETMTLGYVSRGYRKRGAWIGDTILSELIDRENWVSAVRQELQEGNNESE